MKHTTLLVIDAQNDFCNPDGSLYVPGADEDMERVGGLISKMGRRLHNIHCTMDQHHRMSVFHSCFWKEKPNPIETIITHEDVMNKKYNPFHPAFLNRKSMKEYLNMERDGVEEYTEKLNKFGKNPLCIWPEHCLVGHYGANIYEGILKDIDDWETKNNFSTNFISKGSNPFTEHYSALRADVPDPADPTTELNMRQINQFIQTDWLLIAGEALSHCVKETVTDIVENIDQKFVEKIIFLEDGSSPVPVDIFIKQAETFIFEMKKKGMKVMTCEEAYKFLS